VSRIDICLPSFAYLCCKKVPPKKRPIDSRKLKRASAAIIDDSKINLILKLESVIKIEKI
jgi:hypothetical protein